MVRVTNHKPHTESDMTEHYVENEAYNAAVNAIAARTGLAPDEIKIALGEHANIWPESIQGDVDCSS
jgi:hypothetical protein